MIWLNILLKILSNMKNYDTSDIKSTNHQYNNTHNCQKYHEKYPNKYRQLQIHHKNLHYNIALESLFSFLFFVKLQGTTYYNANHKQPIKEARGRDTASMIH